MSGQLTPCIKYSKANGKIRLGHDVCFIWWALSLPGQQIFKYLKKYSIVFAGKKERVVTLVLKKKCMYL
jgi:hypothetical protein